ncbi:hypothetical protein C2G38_2106013 [Gigaspora rosea]|uniref:Uncharacterized protein n=1 Tax=Gigaspora rosea TaxID=44941 RepID=A0A397UK08_9GLOM|nr:hypothetical protein C2G38_2106013 [Gigaspora rosea]
MASKFFSIFIMALVLILNIASSNAQSCTIVWHGRQTHQTGGSKGCYGTDPNDPIYEASCSNCCYVFYSGTGCTGNVVGPGRACNTAKYPGLNGSSVYLYC